MRKFIMFLMLVFVTVSSFSQLTVSDTVHIDREQLIQNWQTDRNNGMTKYSFNEYLITKQIFKRDDEYYIVKQLETPGNIMLESKKQHITGNVFMMSSACLLTVALTRTPSSSTDLEKFTNNTKTMVYISGGLAVIGGILNISAANKLGKAGVILNENGIGVSVPIK